MHQDVKNYNGVQYLEKKCVGLLFESSFIGNKPLNSFRVFSCVIQQNEIFFSSEVRWLSVRESNFCRELLLSFGFCFLLELECQRTDVGDISCVCTHQVCLAVAQFSFNPRQLHIPSYNELNIGTI